MSLTMWWPSPEAFEDLEVTDIEEGWQLSAPDDTELAEWLNFWSQDEEHHAFFEKAFLAVLTNHANFILDQHGKAEDLPDGRQGNPEQAEDERSGMLPEHEPGSNT
jgi:predicted lipoprotein